MKALTIWQPWAWAIAAGHKLVENRDWKAPSAIIGARIAIHAGKTFDAESLAFVAERVGHEPLNGELVTSAVVAVATLERVIGVHQADGLTEEQRRWFFGHYGFCLSDVVRLPEPVKCSGLMKFWPLSAWAEAKVRAQLAEVGRG